MNTSGTDTARLVSDPIVHRTHVSMQQDYKGTMFETIRVFTKSGKSFFITEEVDAPEPQLERPLIVRLAHKWSIYKDSIQVEPCGQASTCLVCIAHTERTRVVRKHS
jgi:hypothetical protein